MKFNEKELIWAEKYRPQTIDDLIIDKETREIAKEWIKSGNLPNLGLFGYTPGTGKTSFARSLVKDSEGDLAYINASKENGVDVIRHKLVRFASANSMFGGQRVVLLDEADGLTPSSQESLRGFIEEFSQNCRFIITANYKHRIIEPLLNRLNNLEFDDIFSKYKTEIANQILDRCKFVMENEKIKYDENLLKAIIKKFYPSVRQMLIVLQNNSINGELKCDVSALENKSQFDKLIAALESRDFMKCRTEIKYLYDPRSFYDYLFANIDTVFKNHESSIANAITIIHNFMSTFQNVKDPEVSLSAFCATILNHPGVKFVNEKVSL